jgi:uncharacterized protein YjeT (DUF2065 family)
MKLIVTIALGFVAGQILWELLLVASRWAGQARESLRQMSDKELRRFGRGAMELCGKTSREDFVVQLREARFEWQRRHDGGAKRSSRAWRLPRLKA